MKTSGILLPIFSLPSDYGIGCFSKEAYKFVDFLEEAGQKYWQILPLGTIGAGNSPYLSFSSFAGSAYYIDLEQLLEEGLLKKKELESIKEENKGKVDYEKIREDHRKLLRKAYFRFHPDEDYKKFIKDNEYWIGEYAEYMSEKKSKFPESYFCFCQYYFHKQWLALKKYANDKGIQIVGDLPFYVALDGTAFTYHKELFKVDEEGKATVVGGCPPDAFAEDANTVVADNDNIPADYMGLDIGPKSIELYKNELAGAKTVVWNGPMGVFEMKPFAKGTLEVCTAISELPGATTVIGGGDSAAAAIQLGFAEKFSHISTGGGASLEYMEGKELPGIAVISDK